MPNHRRRKGIGKAITLALAKEGVNVILVANRRE
jgi:NAD(P)-dependent dehydrogenase (short-subunit alcohol dehydrogenase family)